MQPSKMAKTDDIFSISHDNSNDAMEQSCKSQRNNNISIDDGDPNQN